MNNTLRVQFFFGIGLDRKGNPLPEALVRSGLYKITNTAVDMFDGCSVLPTTGGWRNPRGQVFYEEGRCLTIDIDETRYSEKIAHNAVSRLAKLIREELNQEGVHVTWSHVSSEYYGD